MEERFAYVPHIFFKGFKVEVNFGQQQYPWHSPPSDSHLLNSADVDCIPIFATRAQINILTVLIGLPGNFRNATIRLEFYDL